MSNNDNSKIYPITTPEVAQMFGIPSEQQAKETAPALNNGQDASLKPGFEQIVGNLYIKETKDNSGKPIVVDAEHREIPAVPKPKKVETGRAGSGHGAIPPAHHVEAEVSDANPGISNMFRALKAVTPYVVVFSVALLVYFYFFGSASFSFGKMFNSQAKVSTPKESSLAQLEKQNLVGYNLWINQFYYDVSDPKVLDPEADNSGNGLSNFQKYLLNLNPKSYDTLGLGLADSESLNKGINPLTGNKLTDAQKSIVAQYFDMEVVMNRLALSNLQKNGSVAGASVSQSGYHSFSLFPQSAQASNNQESVSATDVLGSNNLDVDTNKPGHLDIPSLKISVPLIWSQSPAGFDKDLQSGVIHYPGTAMPGQIGTSYISGHSSNYSWAKGDYNHIFTHLNELADNTSFSITVTLSDGKTAVLHYVVVGRQQYDAKDQAQFKNGGKSVVALSTCWPVGSTAKRLVVFGELTQVEK